MKFRDQFKFVRANMKKNKSRIFMTILATAMGCAFLIVLASVAFGIQESVVDDVTQGRLMTEINVHGKEEGGRITDDDIEYFESLENVDAVTRRNYLRQGATYFLDDYRSHAGTLVVNYPSEVKAGFELSEGRLPEAEDEIVVGYDFGRTLAEWDGEGDPPYGEEGTVKEGYEYEGAILNKTLQMEVKKMDGEKEESKQFTLKIVGIGKKPSRDWMVERNVYISEGVMSKIEAFTGTQNGMTVAPDTPEGENNDGQNSTKKTYDEVNIFAKHAEDVKGISDTLKDKKYYTYSVVNEMEQINLIFLIAKSGLIFIGTIAIIIASIGIYNTMTMAVTERAPDIGIMKAIGANPSTIKRIFLIESSYIGLLGALFGTAVAYGISYLVNLFLPMILGSAFGEQPPDGFMFSSIPLALTIICITICMIVTIISGLRPARRATKVDVLKAMRREV
ncbi:ABC transporter permease [Pseudalkalibacillus sp. SCS-8]|uniref:ABC transporter permease n=1 Tax=Pseudalkalibacillus nanhaiensis TaxID=3115291 RepID=UPI0032DA11BA